MGADAVTISTLSPPKAKSDAFVAARLIVAVEIGRARVRLSRRSRSPSLVERRRRGGPRPPFGWSKPPPISVGDSRNGPLPPFIKAAAAVRIQRSADVADRFVGRCAVATATSEPAFEVRSRKHSRSPGYFFSIANPRSSVPRWSSKSLAVCRYSPIISLSKFVMRCQAAGICEVATSNGPCPRALWPSL